MIKKILKVFVVVVGLLVVAIVIDEMRSDVGIFDHPKLASPTRKAKNACIDYLIKSQQGFEILNASAVKNDTELGFNTPPISVIVTVRMQGPYGPKKGMATFACTADGQIIMPTLWPDYFIVIQR